MKSEETKKTVVGVYLVPGRDEFMLRNSGGETGAKLIERISLDGDARSLRREKGWKTELIKTVEGLGYEVVSNPSFLVHEQDGIQIVMSVVRKGGLKRLPSKPVVRSGRQISAPVIGRTMATLRREGGGR